MTSWRPAQPLDGLRPARMITTAVVVLLVAVPSVAPAANCLNTSTGLVPLTQLGAGTYQGRQGGLYPGGSNVPPPGYHELGRSLGALVLPRNAAGLPDPAGRTVMLTIGMSNTRIESDAIIDAASDDARRDPRVLIVNGAQGGQPAEAIADPAAPYWTFVDGRLEAAGASGAQVQVVWLKEANARPTLPFPQHAEGLRDDLAAIVQTLDTQFPNLSMIYLSSRIYAGYASTTLNPEPYAYESGFSVKWLIEDRIEQPSPGAWLGWGPSLWADGLAPREGDGVTWRCDQFGSDGTHPNLQGARQVADLMLGFLHTDATTTWYMDPLI